MSALLRLYPRAWRERYGDELVALLEEQPASLLDHLDLIRGALDARLHPQVRGAGAPPEREIPMTQRSLGVVAAIGGIVWLVAIASMVVLPKNDIGERDLSIAWVGIALGIAVIGIALGELGTRPDSPASARTGHLVAGLGVVFGALLLMGWPFVLVGALGFPVLVVAAAQRGAGNGVMPGWFVVVFLLAAVAFTAGAVGQDTRNGELGPILIGSMALVSLLLAWLALTRHTAAPAATPA